MAKITVNGHVFEGTAQECAQFMAFMSMANMSMSTPIVNAPQSAYVASSTPTHTHVETPTSTPTQATVYEHVDDAITVKFVHESRKINGKLTHVIAYTLMDGKYVYHKDVRKCVNEHIASLGAKLVEESYTDKKGNAKTRNVYTLGKADATKLNGTEFVVTSDMRNAVRDKWTAKAERKAKKGAKA